MPPPTVEPIGLLLARTSKATSRAFDQVLVEAGASLPTWLVLVSLQGSRRPAQRELAAAIGIEGPTLTHHLNRMETDGLVTRTRDPENRRAHQVALTDEGRALFRRLVGAVSAFDARLRSGIDEDDLDVARRVLGRLASNSSPEDVEVAP
jgi:MarR family transcriptional regulator for hemolysin